MMFINPQSINEGDLLTTANGTAIYTQPIHDTTTLNQAFYTQQQQQQQQQQQKQTLANVQFSNASFTNTNYSTLAYGTAPANAGANIFPLNLAMFNPHQTLTCNYNQTPILTQPFTQLSAIPSFTNHPLLSKKCKYSVKPCKP